jgi:hypothetical protein
MPNGRFQPLGDSFWPEIQIRTNPSTVTALHDARVLGVVLSLFYIATATHRAWTAPLGVKCEPPAAWKWRWYRLDAHAASLQLSAMAAEAVKSIAGPPSILREVVMTSCIRAATASALSSLHSA